MKREAEEKARQNEEIKREAEEKEIQDEEMKREAEEKERQEKEERKEKEMNEKRDAELKKQDDALHQENSLHQPIIDIDAEMFSDGYCPFCNKNVPMVYKHIAKKHRMK
jgi:flagellar biosynthesis GTPase FlhF